MYGTLHNLVFVARQPQRDVHLASIGRRNQDHARPTSKSRRIFNAWRETPDHVRDETGRLLQRHNDGNVHIAREARLAPALHRQPADDRIGYLMSGQEAVDFPGGFKRVAHDAPLGHTVTPEDLFADGARSIL